jgi:hypothetical protein
LRKVLFLPSFNSGDKGVFKRLRDTNSTLQLRVGPKICVFQRRCWGRKCEQRIYRELWEWGLVFVCGWETEMRGFRDKWTQIEMPRTPFGVRMASSFIESHHLHFVPWLCFHFVISGQCDLHCTLLTLN